jgi:elongator complex protein 3
MTRKHKPNIDHTLPQHHAPLRAILAAILNAPRPPTEAEFQKVVRAHPKPEGGLYRHSDLIAAYRDWAGTDGLPPFSDAALRRLQLKPVRTSSGVAPVTILTKPFPCPGTCVFCPNDVRMPKSYLSDEPGAQRAEQNAFDPYLQTMSRLRQLALIGHPTDKIEIIILGGTWSFYPESYQIWFVLRVFDALHDFGDGLDRSDEVRALLASRSRFAGQPLTEVRVNGADPDRSYNQTVQTLYADEMARSRDAAVRFGAGLAERTVVDEYATWGELAAAHRLNEVAACRCVGLVVETRPDHIDAAEVLRARRLGCTKVQIGFQSLDDRVLSQNRRGHDVAATRRAVALLRRAGFKIHAHWMPNLYGATPDSDRADYARLFDDPDFRPDELKIYPCSLIESAELMQIYQAGGWRPYDHETLLNLLADCMAATPPYVRLTRIIRDIPSTDIVDGNRLTNFRQLAEDELRRRGQSSADIRAREVRYRRVEAEALSLDVQAYQTGVGHERFLQFVTPDGAIAGFLRLALPDPALPPLTPELAGAAIIREVHVYGQVVGLGAESDGKAQHAGLGTALIGHAVAQARAEGYRTLAVISAVGTREYYRKRGFADSGLYQVRPLYDDDSRSA